MKKLASVVITLAVAVMAAGLAVAGPKAPKALCLHLSAPAMPDHIILSIQPVGGSIRLSEGTIKFYSIHGEYCTDSYSIPLTGTGHLNGNVFHFDLRGTDRGAAWQEAIFNATYDVTTDTSVVLHSPSGSPTYDIVDCDSVIPPFK